MASFNQATNSQILTNNTYKKAAGTPAAFAFTSQYDPHTKPSLY